MTRKKPTPEQIEAERERDFRRVVGRNLAAIRRARGLTAQECAAAGGASAKATWYRWTTGEAPISAWSVYRFAQELGLSIDEVLPQ